MCRIFPKTHDTCEQITHAELSYIAVQSKAHKVRYLLILIYCLKTAAQRENIQLMLFTFTQQLTFAVDSAGICKTVVTFSVLTFTGVLTFSGATHVERTVVCEQTQTTTGEHPEDMLD